MNLTASHPDVFVYSDKELMKAGACINADAVAFYDGSLHVVARPDIWTSQVHEYTHHFLFSNGLWGPAWAQEGIAMSVANEIWWRNKRQLQAVLDRPFSIDDMDHAIPYKLPPQQAVLFYVQSALTVECLLRVHKWSLRQLYDLLHEGGQADSIRYDLPELADRSFLPSCAASFAR